MENLQTKISMLHILVGFFLSLSAFGFIQEANSLGINYGQVGNNLPAPQKVLELLRSLKLTKARIYDTNPNVLAAFANSDVDLIVTIENQILPELSDPNQALQWVSTRIKPYFPATNITGVAVGNEVFTGDDTTLINYLVPAMVNIHAALVKLELNQFIHVSTPNNLAVLKESFPPSAGTFRPELAGIMPKFLQFLAATKSPFWINAYPYFAYKDDPDKIRLEYALLSPNPGMTDPGTGLHYDNMMYAQVDAVVFAMARMGFGGLDVRVSETGWPSSGDADEVGATVENAAVYNRNIFRRQMRDEGTPLRPGSKLEIYVFALFNEDMKPGPASERNYGLFRPDGTMAYSVGLSPLSTTTSSSSSAPTSTSTSSIIFLTSNASQVKKMGFWSLMYSTLLLYLLVFQVVMRRQW